MVVDDVQHHGEARLMGSIQQGAQPDGAAVGAVDASRVNAVVSPVASAGEFRNRHELDRSDAESPQRGQARDDRLERTRRGERANVELIDDITCEWWGRPGSVCPRE